MRSHIRTVAVVVLALALLGLFLRNVDFGGVLREIVHAHPGWLLLSLATMLLNLVIRAWRWQFLLEPLGKASFANSFRATAVGFAARSFLPAAAGELVRPYFLSRREPMSATGAFATIVIERLLDTITVLILLASYVFVFGRGLSDVNPTALAAVKWAGATAGAVSMVALRRPVRHGRAIRRGSRRCSSAWSRSCRPRSRGSSRASPRSSRRASAPSGGRDRWSRRCSGRFRCGCASRSGSGRWPGRSGSTCRSPVRSCIIALLTIGIAIPTPGSVGGFHEAFRLGVTVFYGAPDSAAVGAAIVLHAMSVGSPFFLGVFFAAQEGLNLAGIRHLADQAEPGRTA